MKGTPPPPEPEHYYYKSEEYIKGMLEVRGQYKSNLVQAKSGIRNKKSSKIDCFFSVICFVKAGGGGDQFKDGRSIENFK